MRRRLKATGRTSPLSIRLPLKSSGKRSGGSRTLLALPDDSPAALKTKFSAALANFPFTRGDNPSFLTRVLVDLRVRIPAGSATASILCLGLGNPAVDAASLRQLAFLSAMIEASEGLFSPAKTFLYDPVLKTTSREFIRRQGFKVRLGELRVA